MWVELKGDVFSQIFLTNMTIYKFEFQNKPGLFSIHDRPELQSC